MDREDVLSFLTKLKKTISEDPAQTRIGSYNIRKLTIISCLNGSRIQMNLITDYGKLLYALKESRNFKINIYPDTLPQIFGPNTVFPYF